MTTIAQQQTNSAILTGLAGISTVFAALSAVAGNEFNLIIGAVTTAALAFINHTQTATTATTTTETTAAAAATVTASSDKFDPGFVPLPASQSIMSGQIATISLAAGKSAVTCTIDWRDNTGTTTLAFANGQISATHQYAYEFDGKHQSHAYHPLFTLKDATGRTKVFDAADDTATGGVDCTIGVTALGYPLVQY